MRTKLLVVLALIGCSAALTNCKKSTSAGPGDPPVHAIAPATIAELFTVNGASTQVIQVSSTAAQTITVNGVKIEIPANAFLVASNGNTITGTVDLSVKTVLSKSEVILSGAGANSSSNRLVSTKGCVKVTAGQNGQSLRLGGGGSFFVNVPDGTTAPPPMKKYYAPKVTASDSTIIWKYGTDVSDIPIVFDASSGKYQHHASLDSLKWLNVGQQFDTTGAKTSVTVTLGSGFTKANSVVYLSVDGSLTIGALYEITPGVFRIRSASLGKAANIVVIAVSDGKFFENITPITVTANMALNISPAETTIESIKSNLSALP